MDRTTKLNQILELIENDDIQLEEAVLMIKGHVEEDDKILNSFADQVQRNRDRGIWKGKCLSRPRHGREGQVGWARRLLVPRYLSTLLDLGWLTEERSEAVKSLRKEDEDQERDPRPRKRLDQLIEAHSRIVREHKFIETAIIHFPDADIDSAQTRLDRLQKYAEQLILDANEEEAGVLAFIRIAKEISPCPRCLGTGIHEDRLGTDKNDACARCKGKGFQTSSDQFDNRKHDLSQAS